jgi:hypothetical protein
MSRVEVGPGMAVNWQDYIVRSEWIHKDRIPGIIRHRLEDQKLRLRLFTNVNYAGQKMEASISVKTSKPLNRFQLEASNESFTVANSELTWKVCQPVIKLDDLKYGDSFELQLQIIEYSVKIEYISFRSSLPLSVRDSLQVGFQTAEFTNFERVMEFEAKIIPN